MNDQQRTASADKTLVNQGQDINHSAKELLPEVSDELSSSQALTTKRPKLKLPPASAKEEWESIDQDLVQKLNAKLAGCSLKHKLASYGDLIYATCKEKYGVKETKEKPPPQKSRRQREMENIRKQKRSLKIQIKKAPVNEKRGLEKLWQDLKTKHSALSKAETLRKRRSKRKKTHDSFFKDPFQFARKLFEQPKSGTLTIEKEALEEHLRKTYSDKQSETPLEIDGLVHPPEPQESFNSKPPTLDEVRSVVQKARSKLSPGPNGITLSTV